jgi:hypothetical protein
VTYGRTADFLADVERQVSRRGLLVRVELGAVERGAAVELEIVTPVGRVLIPASVLQPLPGAGVAVELDPERFAQLVAAAKRGAMTDGPAPIHDGSISCRAAAGPVEEPSVDDELPVPRAAARRSGWRARGGEKSAALHGDKN